jgi:hypothetical protein
MKVSKETLQSLQNVIDLTEQKNKTEQDAISLEKESNEVSAQISEENSAYQRLLDSARENLRATSPFRSRTQSAVASRSFRPLCLSFLSHPSKKTMN